MKREEYIKKTIWKPIKGFEGKYEVSNDGQVRSLERIVKCRGGAMRTVKGRICKQSKNMSRGGYFAVGFSGGSKNNHRVHRLVAEAFIPNPENKPCVNHIDANRENNSVENLEWCYPIENIHHTIKLGRWKTNRGEKCGRAKLNEYQVREIRRRYMQKESSTMMAKEFNVSKSAICNIVHGRAWVNIL